jgi:hypothetical protein
MRIWILDRGISSALQEPGEGVGKPTLMPIENGCFAFASIFCLGVLYSEGKDESQSMSSISRLQCSFAGLCCF